MIILEELSLEKNRITIIQNLD